MIKAIAIACHQQNKTWCEANGDHSQVDWTLAPAWQQASAIKGVECALAGQGPTELHESWCETKRAEGWVFGLNKDPEKKTHPCLMPYSDLPDVQKRKDALFLSMVVQLAWSLGLTIEDTKNT